MRYCAQSGLSLIHVFGSLRDEVLLCVANTGTSEIASLRCVNSEALFILPTLSASPVFVESGIIVVKRMYQTELERISFLWL